MNIRPASDAVFTTTDPMVCVDAVLLDLLRSRAPDAPRKRVRFNAHAGPDQTIQEMIIALARDTYIPPHKHIGKSESFHVIEGEVDVVLFSDDGFVLEVVRLGSPGSGKVFYYRNCQPQFHAVVAQSDVVIFHETTNGPFHPEDTILATWAPPTEGPEAVQYLNNLRTILKERS